MITAGDFRPGMVVELDGELHAVLEFHHIERGRGTAALRAKFRHMKTGAITERTFMPEERFPRPNMEQKRMQYLYRDEGGYVFMDLETYDQIHLPGDLVGDGTRWLKENAGVSVVFYEGRAIAVELPNSVELEVVETAPGVRGATVAGSSKPAKLETRAAGNGPFLVSVGGRIKVDTRTGEYIEPGK